MRALFSFLIVLLCQVSFAQTTITWVDTVDVSTVSGIGNVHPRVAYDRVGDPLVVWGNNTIGNVNFARWDNGLRVFTTPTVLNPSPTFVSNWAGPDIATFGDTVYVVYKLEPFQSDTSHVFCVHSYDGGRNFAAPVRVDNIGLDLSRFPSVTTDSVGNPVVSFMRFNRFAMQPRHLVVRSTDAGASFGADVLASGFGGGSVCDCCPSSMTARGNEVAVLFRAVDSVDIRNIFAAVSLDAGATIAAGIDVDHSNWASSTCPSSAPDGVIVGDSLYTVYMSEATGDQLAYFSKSSMLNLQGGTGMPITGMLPLLQTQNHPRIAALGNAVAMGWVQEIDTFHQLTFMYTDDITHGFPAPYTVVVNDNTTNFDIAMSPGKICLVWQESQLQTVRAIFGTITGSASQASSEVRKLSVSPNPAQRSVQVRFPKAADYKLRVLDATGKEVALNVLQLGQESATLDVESLPSGLYLVSVTDETGAAYTVRFVRAQ